jgi:flagellar protein FliS
MNGFGAKAYSKVAVETGAGTATSDPHALVLMLYDGALAAARQGLGHMHAGRIGEKAAALSKVTRIIDEGLKISLDKSSGGQLALRLGDLYDYMTMRLLQSNLRNDAAALAEVIKLLEDLRGAWAQIRKQDAAAQPVTASSAAAGASAVAAPAPQSASAGPASPATRFFDATYPQPLRRVATA